MDIDNLDFDGTSKAATNAGGSTVNNDGQDAIHLDSKPDDNHNLDNKDNKGGEGSDTKTSGFQDATKQDKADDANKGSDAGDGSSLKEGDNLEIDGQTYTVDANGNIVDAKGNVFKEAKDVADWLKSVNVDDGTNTDNGDGSLSLNSIQEAIGIQVNDADGNPVEYTDDAEGAKAYIEDVIKLRTEDVRQGAINKLFTDNPMLAEFANYLVVNNGSPYGFAEIPDRSKIQLDKDNANQQEAIIRLAAQEFGNKSVNDNYIAYLKNTGGLYDEARAQLANLVEKDNNTRKQIEAEANARRAQEAQAVNEYWNNVNNLINNRIIGGYKLPESFVKEVNGTKVTLTPSDFFNYLQQPAYSDENGNSMTGYQHDLAELSDEDALNREMLDAWLMFTGGTYKDLINLAVNEDKVRTLKINSQKQRSARTIKVVSKKAQKTDIDDIVLS